MWRDFQSDGSVDRKVLNSPVAFAGESFKKQITLLPASSRECAYSKKLHNFENELFFETTTDIL